jgi:uncharacterized membrane protein YdbT with pleckstrin-like domain
VTTLRETIPLRKRKILKKLFTSAARPVLPWAVLLLSALGFFYIDPGKLPPALAAHKPGLWVLWLALAAVVVLWNPVYQVLYFIRYFYDIQGSNIVIRKGVLTRREITLPFSRITDVYVDQDFFDVLFGLYDVHISTPTQQSGLFAHIDGVNRQGSARLRQLILDAISKTEGAEARGVAVAAAFQPPAGESSARDY